MKKIKKKLRKSNAKKIIKHNKKEVNMFQIKKLPINFVKMDSLGAARILEKAKCRIEIQTRKIRVFERKSIDKKNSLWIERLTIKDQKKRKQDNEQTY